MDSHRLPSARLLSRRPLTPTQQELSIRRSWSRTQEAKVVSRHAWAEPRSIARSSRMPNVVLARGGTQVPVINPAPQPLLSVWQQHTDRLPVAMFEFDAHRV